MSSVRPKKHLGQHFLNNNAIAERIVQSLSSEPKDETVIEVGPGTGVLTQFLIDRYEKLILLDIDAESIEYLNKKYAKAKVDIVHDDFLKIFPFDKEPVKIIGNFPYNISSQIFFKVYEQRDSVTEVVGMLQKEVAERIASPPGNKKYGILSVLLQAFYTIEYLFTVGPEEFIPPPKVQSGVIRLKRNEVQSLDCDIDLFKRVVKAGFQNRRKTLRNALKVFNFTSDLKNELLIKRAEQLSVNDFVLLTQSIEVSGSS
ncbi:MAG: 16S rRNA (adenine(1518)-N(6)/adenine(1519)-N(6))-dimethyltransferase RsmA [Bacteroidota bacterium]